MNDSQTNPEHVVSHPWQYAPNQVVICKWIIKHQNDKQTTQSRSEAIN